MFSYLSPTRSSSQRCGHGSPARQTRTSPWRPPGQGEAVQARLDCSEPPKTQRGLWVLSGACPGPPSTLRQLRNTTDPTNPAPTAALVLCPQPTRREAAGLEGMGSELRAGPGHLAQQVHQVKCFSQLLRVLPENSPTAGISIRRLGRVPRTPKAGRWHPELPAAFLCHPSDILRAGGPRGQA